MRALALIAFLGLQLSMFTCGIDIHVDRPGSSTTSQIVQLQHGAGDQGKSLMVHVHISHIHASHVFTDQKAFVLGDSGKPLEFYHLATLNLVSVPNLIEHPPKIFRV